jgi:pimeloyl-ACP methyl ester carboxylesterase
MLDSRPSAALAATPQVAQAWARGLKIHYTSAGTGPTLIFVHGWTCDGSSWRYQIPVFSVHYRVVTLDLPGHGKSASPAETEFSMGLFADAVESVRQALGPDRVVLVGHSMGAAVIRQYALSHPGHVAGLVAVDGPLDLRPFAGGMGVGEAMTTAQREAMIEAMFTHQTSAALRAEINAMMLAAPLSTVNGAAAVMFDPAIQSKQIIHAPALAIQAGTPLFAADPSAKEMLPQLEWTHIPGTGHFLMMEQPEAFNRLLADFLDNLARP